MQDEQSSYLPIDCWARGFFRVARRDLTAAMRLEIYDTIVMLAFPQRTGNAASP